MDLVKSWLNGDLVPALILWHSRQSGEVFILAVLVQREMESGRSPLASIQPFSAGQFGGERRYSDGEWTEAGQQVAEAATGFKKEIRLPWPRLTPIIESRQRRGMAWNQIDCLVSILGEMVLQAAKPDCSLDLF